MDHGNGHVMMMGPPSPSPSSLSSHNAMMMPPHHGKMNMMMMHMTFYWGGDAEILFSGWPGSGNPGMYALSLLVVFLFAALVEWLSRSHFVKPGAGAGGDVVKTLIHVVRMALAYLVMLAVMSFNGCIFIAAIAGHAIGFLVFGTRVFGLSRKDPEDDKPSDLPCMSC